MKLKPQQTKKKKAKPQQVKLSPEEQLEFEKKHIRLIALNFRPKDIADMFIVTSTTNISKTDEGNNRKKLYAAYGFQNCRDVTVYALQHGLITQQQANATLGPEIKIVDWASVKNIE